jgi:hypothetical protein
MLSSSSDVFVVGGTGFDGGRGGRKDHWHVCQSARRATVLIGAEAS